jgi:hypothetical protein
MDKPIEESRRENINNAFDYLFNAISNEHLQHSRELSLVITNIEQAKLWFTKVNCFDKPEIEN